MPLAATADEAIRVLEWYTVDKPGPAGNIIVNPCEITKIAVSSNNYIFAIDTPNNKIYRSSNGGSTWSDITTIAISSGIDTLPAVNIAVAPDNANLVALVTDEGRAVWISTDGGDSWSNSNFQPAGLDTIQCITISKSYALTTSTIVRDIAVGTALWGNAATDGAVWIAQVGGSSISWKDQMLNSYDISALTFSSTYNQGDQVILVFGSIEVTADSITSYLCMGKRDVAANTVTEWNGITSPISYPVLVVDQSAATGTPVEKIISSIALPSDYSSSLFGGTTSADNRVAFISYNRIPVPSVNNLNDVYRIYDKLTSPYNIERLNAGTATGGTSTADISTIALYGTIDAAAPVLLAGDYYNISGTSFVNIRRCTNPFSTTTVSWIKATQPPSGPGQAQIAWNSDGTKAYCGTGQDQDNVLYDESAFSISSDAGDTWQQVSLINTLIRLCDVQPAPDSKSLFVATYNPTYGGMEWIWRAAGEPLGQYWGRLYGVDTTTDRIILRLSPNYRSDYTIYAVETDNTTPASTNSSYIVAVSHDRGNYWIERHLPAMAIDLVVADSQTAYVAIPGGKIRKTTNEGMQWQAPVDTKLNEINMLHLAQNGDLFAASTDGQVSYSTDGGASFTLIPKAFTNYHFDTNTGDVQVITDANYSSNKIIYAADNITDHGIWRWQIGTSSEWEIINEPVVDLGTGEKFCGLAMGEEGTLYALRMEPAGMIDENTYTGGMDRSLNPAVPQAIKIEWDIVNRTLPVNATFDPNTLYAHTMPFLKFSGDLIQNQLWTFDTYNVTYESILSDNYSSADSPVISDSVFVEDCVALVNLDAEGVSSGATLNVKLQESDSAGGPWTDSGDEFNEVTEANDNTSYLLTYTGIKSYIRAYATIAGGNSIFGVQIQTTHPYIYRFIDNICKSGPYIDTIGQIGCDPVTGRNQEVNFKWEQLSLSDQHEFHLDKSDAMDLPVFSAFVVPYSITSPSLVYLAGGEGLGGTTCSVFLNDAFNSEVDFEEQDLNAIPSLECGHTFYWHTRVRHAVTGEYIRSPWSETGEFVVKTGFKVTTPYYGPQLLSPDNGCGCSCTAPVNFSWSPYKETKGYWFELSQNNDMSNPMVHTLVNESTAYQFNGILKCNTNYYWRVMAQRPAESDWSATFSFKAQPAAKAAPQQVKQPSTAVQLYIWFMIGIGALLVICLLILIVRRSRE